MVNTSQDPEYVGPTHHEKKFHKTHFQVSRNDWGSTEDDDYEWVQIRTGRWKRLPRKQGE
jgi:hypothetical protein